MNLNREFKDTAFRKLFEIVENFLDLYLALGGSVQDPSSVKNVTLDDAFYYGLRNDLAYMVDGKLIVFIEHQSTFSPNMPYRMLLYIVKTLSSLVDPRAVYKSLPLKLPAVELYVIHAGKGHCPDVYSLSGLMETRYAKENLPFLCCNVKVLDSRYKTCDQRLKECKVLREYCLLLRYVDCHIEQLIKEIEDKYKNDKRKAKKIVKDLSEQIVKQAVKMAVERCLEENLLYDFLSRYATEIINMISMEYNLETHMQVIHEEGIEIGEKIGRKEGRKEGKEENQIETALRMKKKGLPDNLISELSGLPLEKIKDL